MSNKTIKLTETELRKIIENTVKNVIKEGIEVDIHRNVRVNNCLSKIY